VGDVELSRSGGGVDGVEADGAAAAVPAGVEVAAQVAADEASLFHVDLGQRRTFAALHVVKDERLSECLAVLAVGGEPLLIGREGAVAVEVKAAVAQVLITAPAVGEGR